jgi:uncharacterized protein (TIGR02145 family)
MLRLLIFLALVLTVSTVQVSADQSTNQTDEVCCVGRVGDANGSGIDEPTISDISAMIDAKFISGTCDGILNCLTEADVNQSGGANPTCNDITIGDISNLIDYLFIGGYGVVILPGCLKPPILTTASVGTIRQETAQSGGTVMSDGGATVTARGVCWSTNSAPTVADDKTTDGVGTGTYTSALAGLTAGTIYHVRAYATNGVGTAYGNETDFTTLALNTVVDIDGNVYQTVTIGIQEWMLENLKVTHYRNGVSIPNVTNSTTWSGLTTGAYCEYNNSVGNVTTYGRLYNWYAVNDSRNIAPDGWHVASEVEWQQLEESLGMNPAELDLTGYRGTTEGGKLKEAGTTHWASPNVGATNESGFTALPGGFRDRFGPFYEMNYYGTFWTCTPSVDFSAWSRHPNTEHASLYRFAYDQRFGFSVRCVKDQTVTDIDGNVYKTVTIGTQEWMAEHLKVTHYRNGDTIPNVTVNATWAGLTTGAWCEYNNSAANAVVYGRLYNWYAVNDSRNIAPDGWHVATDAEWQTLINYLGGDAVAGGKLKEDGTAHWHSPNTGATDESNFTALPGGYRGASGNFLSLGYNTNCWSSTVYSTPYAWYRYLDYDNASVGHSYYGDKPYGFAVRCVKD